MARTCKTFYQVYQEYRTEIARHIIVSRLDITGRHLANVC